MKSTRTSSEHLSNYTLVGARKSYLSKNEIVHFPSLAENVGEHVGEISPSIVAVEKWTVVIDCYFDGEVAGFS